MEKPKMKEEAATARIECDDLFGGDTYRETRHATGEAWMMCEECGSKLFSFDGNQDGMCKCPYRQGGRCEP